MARLLEGKVAIITGAGRGIGREEALLMAKHGAKVVVNDLGAHFDGTGSADDSPAQQVVNEIKKAGGEAVANGESVTDFKGAKRIVECAIDTFGKLNIVVNNAGILRDRMIFNMGEEDWDAVIGVHLKGTFNMSRHACEYWREEHKKGNVLNGRIINTVVRRRPARQRRPDQLRRRQGRRRADGDRHGRRDAEVRRHLQRHRAGRAHAPHGRGDAVDRGLHGQEGRRGQVRRLRSAQHRAAGRLAGAATTPKDVHGEVFRVGGGTVWLMQGWHSRRQGQPEAPSGIPPRSAASSRPSSPRASPPRRTSAPSWPRR